MDEGLGNVTRALRRRGLWENTLLLFSADNGGEHVGPGNNYPLRGGKYTDFEGGTRNVAFASGGWLPAALRGTSTDELMHVADVWATFAALAGDPTPCRDPKTATWNTLHPTGPFVPLPDSVDASSVFLTVGGRSGRSELALSLSAILVNGTKMVTEPAGKANFWTAKVVLPRLGLGLTRPLFQPVGHLAAPSRSPPSLTHHCVSGASLTAAGLARLRREQHARAKRDDGPCLPAVLYFRRMERPLRASQYCQHVAWEGARPAPYGEARRRATLALGDERRQLPRQRDELHDDATVHGRPPGVPGPCLPAVQRPVQSGMPPTTTLAATLAAKRQLVLCPGAGRRLRASCGLPGRPRLLLCCTARRRRRGARALHQV